MILNKIETHGLSIAGHGDDSNRDHYAIAGLNKSMRVHQSNLSFDDDSRLHGRNQGQVFVIADEIFSGQSAGAASGAAVDGIVQYLLNEMPWYHMADGEPNDVVLALEDALENARQELQARIGSNDLGLVTSLTLAFVSWPDLYVAQIGRGRVYLWRGGRLVELTRGARTVRERLTLRAAPTTPRVLHRSLELGDVLALLTESVVETWPDTAIADVLKSRENAEVMCRRLLSGEGAGDRTAILARFLPHRTQSASMHDEPSPELEAHRDRPRPKRSTNGLGLRWPRFGRRRGAAPKPRAVARPPLESPRAV